MLERLQCGLNIKEALSGCRGGSGESALTVLATQQRAAKMRISAVTLCLASCCVAFVPQRRIRTQSLRRAATKEVVVVGGGWAGYSAAAALSTSPDVKVTILEASPKASGGLAGGWRTAGGRAVEAGIHGFWREYRNTFDAIEKIGLRVDDVLSDYSPSVLWTVWTSRQQIRPWQRRSFVPASSLATPLCGSFALPF